MRVQKRNKKDTAQLALPPMYVPPGPNATRGLGKTWWLDELSSDLPFDLMHTPARVSLLSADTPNPHHAIFGATGHKTSCA